MAEFHVSISGNDSAVGSAAAPFATLARAQQAMQSSAGSDNTVVHGGTYTLSSPIAMTSADSNSCFISATGETATISGGNTNRSLFTITGATGVAIKGLSLVNTTVTSSDDEKGAITTLNSSAITIEGIDFSNVGIGVVLDDNSHHVTINGNTFADTQASAINMTPLSHDNAIINNTISRVGTKFPGDPSGAGGGAIQMIESGKNLISHNLIQNVPRFGIEEQNYSTSIASGGNTIEYNVILHSGQRTNDVGAIYVFSGDDSKALGDTIRYNKIIDTGPNLSWGIYLDDMTSNAKVYGNFTQGTKMGGVMIHGGLNNEVYNNVLIGNATFGLETLDIGKAMPGNLIHDNVVERGANQGIQIIETDPKFLGPGAFHDNVYINPTGTMMSVGDDTYLQWTAKGGDKGSEVVPSAGFTNPTAGNYSFAPGSVALVQGIPQLPWAQMGPTRNASPPPPPAEVTPGKLTLVLSEDRYKGDAQFVAKIDGKTIGGPTVVTASSRVQTFDFQTMLAVGRHDLEIRFINDVSGPYGDRNLYVDDVVYNGTDYQTGTHAMYTTGSYHVFFNHA